MRRSLKFGLTTAAALMVTAAMSLMGTASAQAAVGTVTVGGQSHQLDGVNVSRLTNYLVEYTPAYGSATGTNQYGFEAAVVDGKVTKVENSVGNMAIPSNGYVLSGHGTSRTWLQANATVGASVTVSTGGGGGGTGATALLPDVGIRTLRNFTISHPTSGQFAGKKLLKFPGVTANVGQGPLEIHGTRSSSTSTDWVAKQTVYNSDGSKTVLPASGATFYYAGDGHNHWHIKDFDSYEIFNAGGTKLRDGEKHGFCFEDNTEYRNWVSDGLHNTPRNPVYVPSNVCGVNQPNATSIMHGLSVGWSDTYPATLPDQAIDITNLSDGTYTVKVTADWQHFWKESNESNNSATAKVKITGNSVTLVSAPDGL